MRYNLIRKMDISNGPGIRVSVFMQGCTFKCKNCFNKETWDFNGGEKFDEKIIDKIIKLCSNPNIKGLSILGGEPLHPKNIEGTTLLAKTFKEKLNSSLPFFIISKYSFNNIYHLGAIYKKELLLFVPFLIILFELLSSLFLSLSFLSIVNLLTIEERT